MLFNLSLGQLLAAFGAITAITVALYLLDRTRRSQVVSVLRFWVVPGQPTPVMRTRRIRQPLSLLMQLLGMLLLLLAVADFQFHGKQGTRHDHILILDTSAWMRAGIPGNQAGNQANQNQRATLMDAARASAIAWLRAVPASDRVLLIRADALSTPATSWESNHVAVARAILDSRPGATALNLNQSLAFAEELQKQAGSDGEIVYAGPGRITQAEADAGSAPLIAGLRYLEVKDSQNNAGLRSVGARRSETTPGGWDLFVRVHNYAPTTRTANITVNMGGAPEGKATVTLPPDSDQQATITMAANAAGVAEIRLYPNDIFAADNYAALELPNGHRLHVTVYTDSPADWRPALESDARIEPEFRAKKDYRADNDGLMILDRFSPPSAPKGDTLWVDPPGGAPGSSPIAVRARETAPKDLRWAADQPLAEGLRERTLDIPSSSVLETGSSDIRVLESDQGPLIAARRSADGKIATIVMGFDPFAGPMRYQLASPLMLANMLRWFAPGTFRDFDVSACGAGIVSDAFAEPDSAPQVITETGLRLPFSIREGKIQFFSGNNARVTVTTPHSERVYSLTLPEMWDTKWIPPAGIRRGIPTWGDTIVRTMTLWPWLAIAGALLLLAEYLFYGRETSSLLRVVRARVSGRERAA